MHRTIVRTVTGLGLLAWSVSALAATVPGTTGKKTGCITQLTAPGLGFPAGKTFKGDTCADGDTCDADGERNGACVFATQLCSNVPSGKCTGSTVKSIRLKAKNGSSQQIGQLSVLEAAAASLPPTGAACTVETPLSVPVAGPDDKGELKRGLLDIRGKTKVQGKTIQTRFQLVCLPATAVMPPPTTPSTTTTLPPTPGAPRAGLKATITGATITGGTVVVTFTLTDDSGVAITPVLATTSDPDEARVRFTLARILVSNQAGEGGTTAFYNYRNYVTTKATSSATQVSSDQPSFDSGGTLAPVDLATGTYTYTFATKVPADADLSLTHTAGAQIERTYQEQALVANPLYSFVPAGGAVTTVIQDTTTAQCNSCHNPLQAHGGGRREVGLCQLCHTDQAIDPETGNTLDFKVMVHKIHAGKELPTIVDGPVGTKYSFVGFRGAVATFGEKVKACRYVDTGGATVPGPYSGLPCDADADCGSAGTVPGTCDATTTVGVAFPQPVRSCVKCHTEGATAARYKTLPSAAACASCHDDANPSNVPSPAGPAGTNHIPGILQGFPDANCRLCHTSSGPEFDINVPGAHTVPEQSTQLPGLNGQILSASGAAGGSVTITFKLTDKTGTAITDIAGFNRVGFAMSGSTTPDFGYTTKPGPLIAPTAVGGGASGTLSGPDANGVFTYMTAAASFLPADATGTWRVGLEARREVTVGGSIGDTDVEEALQNPVKDFSVDGSAVKARREVVDIALCQSCHGVFSKGFSVHGNLRNQVEYCVVCHNPSVSDFARRRGVPGADPNDAPIDLKHMLHKIHTGEELAHKPYIIYGFGGSANDFAEVLYPGDRRDCAKCHDPDTYLLPLPSGVHGTLLTQVSGTPATEAVVGTVPPVQDACLTCHDSDDAKAHAETNTTAAGAEACAVCHGEGADAAVSAVHAREP